jgi:hypothetical protein
MRHNGRLATGAEVGSLTRQNPSKHDAVCSLSSVARVFPGRLRRREIEIDELLHYSVLASENIISTVP